MKEQQKISTYLQSLFAICGLFFLLIGEAHAQDCQYNPDIWTDSPGGHNLPFDEYVVSGRVISVTEENLIEIEVSANLNRQKQIVFMGNFCIPPEATRLLLLGRDIDCTIYYTGQRPDPNDPLIGRGPEILLGVCAHRLKSKKGDIMSVNRIGFYLQRALD